jgi:hypothetical protein
MVEKLFAANRLVRDVQEAMLITNSVCVCCGLTSYANRDQFQTHEILGGVISRIVRTIAVMERKPAAFQVAPLAQEVD